MSLTDLAELDGEKDTGELWENYLMEVENYNNAENQYEVALREFILAQNNF